LKPKSGLGTFENQAPEVFHSEVMANFLSEQHAAL